jgi:5'(3')-deoxyribonucleotidase
MKRATELHGWSLKDSLSGDEIARVICQAYGKDPTQELDKLNRDRKGGSFKSWNELFDLFQDIAREEHYSHMTDVYANKNKITETLKKVNGKWALVSRQDPSKVLQYYHGAGHPSKEWISKVERRVHSFSEGVLDEEKGWYLDGVFPDGRVWIDGHIMDRAAERGFSKRELETLLRLTAMRYSDEIVDKKDFAFQIISKGLGLGAIIVKVERPDGSMLYKVKTSWYKMKPAPDKFQDIYIVESQDKTPKGPKPKVFIDMDGTIADFFGEWSKISGVNHYKDIDKNKVEDALDLIRKHPTFWTNLPLLPHAKELVKFVKENFGDYYILSKPLENDPRSATGKRAWIRAHFQDTPPVDVILTANKAAHAMSGDVANILIDDFGKYIDSWREAGGVGIKYKDTPVAHNIDRVKKTLKDYL